MRLLNSPGICIDLHTLPGAAGGIAMVTNTQPIIQLHHENKDGKVLVETDRQDRFILTVSAAIEACSERH
jgi:hypothetical protein